jgi:hypothetical protein
MDKYFISHALRSLSKIRLLKGAMFWGNVQKINGACPAVDFVSTVICDIYQFFTPYQS